ncbi:MAG: hypothetical protein K2I15_07740, partial [Bacteroides sp.]|nr:hypothetical protein [Bacteroides sp.]
MFGYFVSGCKDSNSVLLFAILSALICQTNSFALWHDFGKSFIAYLKQNEYKRKCITYKSKRIMNIKPLADRVLVLPAPAEE